MMKAWKKDLTGDLAALLAGLALAQVVSLFL